MHTESLFADWRVVAVFAFMLVGAVIDGWKLKVPNWLTFSMILAGWAAWATTGWQGLGLSLAGTFVAGGLLLWLWLLGGMGAGDVKLYAGFGAWMVPMPWFGFENLFWAFAISLIVGGVMALGIIVLRRTWPTNIENAKEIMGDWQNAGSVEEIAKRAKARKPSLTLLPYGVPLTIGSLAYIAWLHQSGLV